MKNRIVSLLLAVCILLSFTVTTAAADEKAVNTEYYSMKVVHTTYYGYDFEYYIDFMVLTEGTGNNPKVYIKAEDFSNITSDAGYYYEYNQTYTECAFVSNETGHIIRFQLNSPKVSVFYACNDISYTAPYDTLYQNGVTWLPFEFAAKLLYMEAVPLDDCIHVSSVKYNPLAVTNLVHDKIRDYGFDKVKELGRSEISNAIGSTGASIATACNRLLSFEPSEWAATLSCLVGQSTLYDSEYAGIIGESFVLPSEQETEKTNTFILEKFAGSTKAYDKMMTSNVITGKPQQQVNNAIKAFNMIVEKHPNLGKMKSVQNLKDLANDKSTKKAVNELFVKLGHFYDHGGETLTKSVGFLVETIKILDYYRIYKNKNDRAVAALKQYCNDTKYEETFAFEAYCATAETPFLGYLGEAITDKLEDIVNDGAIAAMGPVGIAVKGAGFIWNFISGFGPLKSGIDSTEKGVVSDFALKYQDECLGIYYDYYSKCIAEGGTNAASLEKLLNAMYAYLKFSYIARNSSASSHVDAADALPFETKNYTKDNALMAAEILNKNNEPIAELLLYMEQDIFTPSDAEAYAKSRNDEPFATTLKAVGTPVECPTQDTVPVFEFPDFPGAKGIDYIDEEDAIELTKRAVDNLTGGLLDGMVGGFLSSAMGVEELYTYQVVDNYINGEDMAFVVQMYSAGHPDALFFVSIIGNEVWMGSPSDSAPGGYYVYTDLDLLHADTNDLIGAIGGLAGELFSGIY